MHNKNQDDLLSWWREARFGLFIHWGLYAVHGGMWKGRELPGIGEWLMAQFKVPLAEYRTLADRFNPIHFDADQIAALAAQAGMKYLVITAKHHEGFAMWDSKVSDYSIVKATPYKRDPMKDLSAACAKHGLRLCFYYSQALDWEHPDGGGNDWDFDESAKIFQRYLDEKVKPQLRELLTGYGPIGLIWCDTPKYITREQSADLKQFIQSIQPDCLVSGRIGHGLGDYGSLGDNQIPAGRLKGDWETPATINNTWGYKTNDHHWKSPDTLLRLLVDLASKGVNYLLNIGPDAEGRIPQPSVDCLKAIGAWMDINRQAIHETSANPYPYEFDWGRITQKGNTLFLILTDPQPGPFRLNGLHTVARSARWLHDGTQIPLAQEHHDNDQHHTLTLDFGDTLPDTLRPIVCAVELDGPAVVDERCMQQPDGVVLLPAHMATLHISEESRKQVRPMESNNQFAAIQGEAANLTQPDHMTIGYGGLIERWTHTRDWIEWTFHIFEPGDYHVMIHTVAAKYQDWVGGHTMNVACAQQQLETDITPDEEITQPRAHLFAERATRAGKLHLERAGSYTLHLRATRINDKDPAGCCVGGIRMIPAT